MKVLLTNDDGIHAKGLWALYKRFAGDHEVTVIAPDRERSAVGHGITLNEPLRTTHVEVNGGYKGYAISGSQTDCIKLGVLDITAEKQKTEKQIQLLRKGDESAKRIPLRQLKKKDGTTFAAEISAGAFFSEGCRKIIGAVRDITIRHRAEEELKQTKQRLQHVLTSSPAVIYACNPAGDCATTFISDNVKSELGYEPREFMENFHFWIDQVHPDDVGYVKAEFAKLVDRGSHVLEYRFRHKDGSYRWMRDELRLLFDDQAKSVKVVGSWTDITDMKQTEEALRKSEQQFRDLIENSPVGISIIQNGRLIFENPEQKKICSFAAESSLGKFLDRVHPDDLEKFKKAHRSVVSGNQDTVEIDFRIYPPAGMDGNGDMRWLQCRATRFQYQRQDALLINAIDITEAKQLEHQLLIKNKMLSLGRVAAGIAHEIRNPLTGINTYLYTIEDLCESDRLGPEDVEVIRQIQAAPVGNFRYHRFSGACGGSARGSGGSFGGMENDRHHPVFREVPGSDISHLSRGHFRCFFDNPFESPRLSPD